MLLTKKKQQAVWARREDVDHRIRIFRSFHAKMVCDLLGKNSRVSATRYILMSRPIRHREGNQRANIGQLRFDVGLCLRSCELSDVDGDRNIPS